MVSEPGFDLWLTHVPTPSFRLPFRTPCRHCFPRFAHRFARSSVPVLDRRILVEIPHRSLFIPGLNALISKIPVYLRRRQLPWTRRIRSLTWRRSLMSWVVRMHSRLDWLCTTLRVMHLLGGKPISKPKRGVAIMVSEPGYETVGSKDLTCEDWMVNTRTDADLSAAVQNALQTLLPQIRAEIREEFRTSSGPSDAGGIFDVMGCEDAFKTRLAVYKFEGNALAWWKAYKQAKGGDAWLITVTWADFKKLFFPQFFPRAEQERLKREYNSIRQTSTETSTEFM
nr:hypothetical protein [Tanacetum cinerariifolium]